MSVSAVRESCWLRRGGASGGVGGDGADDGKLRSKGMATVGAHAVKLAVHVVGLSLLSD